ncbi:lysine N(6)-hydroxylase/L-ornithine N(5)-oxygenase family protein [Pseudomonas bananamidigenes]|uniref:lysine N(6)-hydroxylase/L-ornithine N(5)-oxygenase family protein n=1 Tax=Pseudomonas bananamidigenes TaxID=2843610 RepID=UPI001C3FF9F3|nr:SidA/IucD/PvdA family monooxygenase [Pseudomonas bananamidigenes]
MENEIYDCVGIGCGPSNLSIAAQLHGRREVRNIFFEKKAEFSWHSGMMLPDACLQVSMFKDLVTLTEPTNPFSFVSYLHQHGRLLPFLNAQFAQISRLEFADYLKWAAHTNQNVHFGESVEAVDFDGQHFVVQTSRRQTLCKNIVVGVGIEPYLPEFARPHVDDESNFHIYRFADKPRRAGGRRVVVVGGGQSGAEVVLELLRRTGEEAPSEVSWVSRRENFSPIDDSPFANDLFTPAHSDFFYSQDASYREAFLKRNELASDGISGHTLRSIYQRIYTLRYIEHSPMVVRLMPSRSVGEVWRDQDCWKLAAQHQGCNDQEMLEADLLLWATGFRAARHPFLGALEHRFEREGGEIRVDRDFAAIWSGPADRQIFMLNAARGQRGLADPNLSLAAWRGQIVIDRILNRPRSRAPGADTFVNWAALQTG